MTSEQSVINTVIDISLDKPVKKRNLYFDNELVESLMNKYIERGCVDIHLRDEIMDHADELIRQTIRAHNFEYITPGRDQSSFNELFQVAWMQIEKTLYKYDNSPGSSKLFNLWSQIAKTRILAYLKKEKRDKKNMPSYKDYVVRKYKTKSKSIEDFEIFLEELIQFFKYDDDLLKIIEAMKILWLKDDKPHEAFKIKLKNQSGLDMVVVNHFFKILKLHRDEFSINFFDNKYEEDDGAYFYVDQDE